VKTLYKGNECCGDKTKRLSKTLVCGGGKPAEPSITPSAFPDIVYKPGDQVQVKATGESRTIKNVLNNRRVILEASNGAACVDNDSALSEGSEGQMTSCAATPQYCTDDKDLTDQGAPAGWFKTTCCATCAKAPIPFDALESYTGEITKEDGTTYTFTEAGLMGAPAWHDVDWCVGHKCAKPIPPTCVDDEAKLVAESGGQLDSCHFSFGQRFCFNDTDLVLSGASAGWFNSTCCNMCSWAREQKISHQRYVPPPANVWHVCEDLGSDSAACNEVNNLWNLFLYGMTVQQVRDWADNITADWADDETYCNFKNPGAESPLQPDYDGGACMAAKKRIEKVVVSLSSCVPTTPPGNQLSYSKEMIENPMWEHSQMAYNAAALNIPSHICWTPMQEIWGCDVGQKCRFNEAQRKEATEKFSILKIKYEMMRDMFGARTTQNTLKPFAPYPRKQIWSNTLERFEYSGS
jgi:hypothetical protein